MTTDQLKHAAQKVLEENILKFWMEKMYDPKGGFYGRMDGRGVLHPEAERGAVLNARLLWTFSAAYRVLKKPEYLKMAEHELAYLLAHFVDKEHWGVYWSVTADGEALDTHKQIYAQAFMLGCEGIGVGESVLPPDREARPRPCGWRIHRSHHA